MMLLSICSHEQLPMKSVDVCVFDPQLHIGWAEHNVERDSSTSFDVMHHLTPS
jgi:hypothetical protein